MGVENIFWENCLWVKIFWGEKLFWAKIFLTPCQRVGGVDRGGRGDGGDGGGEVDQGGYPPSDLECLSRQDSENIAHC